MKFLKKYGKTLGIFLLFLVLLSFLLSIFHWQMLFTARTTDLIMMVLMLIFFGVIGFQYGKAASKKGYLEGLKIGCCFIFFLIFINAIFYQSRFSLTRIIYYVVLILSSVLGSMLGINHKKGNE